MKNTHPVHALCYTFSLNGERFTTTIQIPARVNPARIDRKLADAAAWNDAREAVGEANYSRVTLCQVDRIRD